MKPAKSKNIVAIGMSDARLRRLISTLAANSGNVLFSTHARKRMKERRILATQVLYVLTHGMVIEPAHQDIHGNWKCTLQATSAGEVVKVAAALTDDASGKQVVVITVMN